MNKKEFLELCGKKKSPYLKRYFYIKEQTDIWTTKDKRKIRINQMNDDHLLNTIRLLNRKLISFSYLFDTVDILDFYRIDYEPDILKAMRKEAKKRGLIK